MISLVTRLIGLPLPLVIALFVVRSDVLRNSVKLAFRNRDLATRSGRLARREKRIISEDPLLSTQG